MDESTRLKLAAEVAGVREVFFPCSRVGEIQKDIHHLHFRDNGVSEGGVLTSFGESRCGKSKLLGDYAAHYPHQPHAIVKENGDFADRKEVLLMTVPDAKTRNLLERLLALLTNQTTEQVKGSGVRRFDIEEAIVHFATETQLRLLILDETHQGISNRTIEATKDTASVIKNLSNAAQFALVIAGTMEAQRLLDASPELAGRVLYEYELAPFSWDVPAERATFLDVLRALDQHLAANVFGRLSGLAEPETALWLNRASLGYVGHAATLIEVAGVMAVADMAEGRTRSLTSDHLFRALAKSPLRRMVTDEMRAALGLPPQNARHSAAQDASRSVGRGEAAGNHVTRLRGRTRRAARSIEFRP